MKKTIAVDIDDVLAANAEGFVQFTNERWGTNLKVTDYDEHWGQIWGVDHQETIQRVVGMQEEGFQRNLKHFSDALPILQKLAQNYRLVILTSRRQHMVKDTEDWITEYFPDIFEDIYYSGAWEQVDDEATNRTKATLCIEKGVDYLIDDQLKHCLAVVEVGVQAVLYGDYSWNQINTMPKNMIRVTDWNAVWEYFSAKT